MQLLCWHNSRDQNTGSMLSIKVDMPVQDDAVTIDKNSLPGFSKCLQTPHLVECRSVSTGCRDG